MVMPKLNIKMPALSKKKKVKTEKVVPVELSLTGRNIESDKPEFRNANVIIIGGSGTGKTRYVIKPNILQMNCSYIITDPKGELLTSTGRGLLEKGYRLSLFSTNDMLHSNCFNPFDYLYKEDGSIDETQVQIMVDTFLKNMDEGQKGGGDQYWNKAASAFMTFAVFYLLEFCPEDQRNMYSVLKVTQAGKADESSSSSQTALDKMVADAKGHNQNAKCFISYDTYKLAPAKTANSVLSTLAVNLNKFGENDQLRNLTTTDYLCKRDKDGLITKFYVDSNKKLIKTTNNIDLRSMGDVKTALFVNIPAANGTLNFLVSMLYSSFFNVNYAYAEKTCLNQFNIHDHSGNVIKGGFKTKEEAEDFASYCVKSKIVEETETIKFKKRENGELVDAEIEDKRYYLFNKNAPEAVCIPEMTYKNGLDNKKIGYLMEVSSREIGEMYQKQFAKSTAKQGKIQMPIPIRCLLDEFVNIGEIPNFNKMLATMRSYWISCTIVIQSIALIKAKYEKDWEAVIGNCDTVIFLGSQENSTCEYISKMLGDATIRSGNTSISHSKSGGSESIGHFKRALLQPAEVKRLDNNYEVVMIRGLQPMLIRKYDYINHPNYYLTGDFDRDREIKAEYLEQHFLCRAKDRSDTKETISTNEQSASVASGSNPDGTGSSLVDKPTEIKTEEDFKQNVDPNNKEENGDFGSVARSVSSQDYQFSVHTEDETEVTEEERVRRNSRSKKTKPGASSSSSNHASYTNKKSEKIESKATDNKDAVDENGSASESNDTAENPFAFNMSDDTESNANTDNKSEENGEDDNIAMGMGNDWLTSEQ